MAIANERPASASPESLLFSEYENRDSRRTPYETLYERLRSGGISKEAGDFQGPASTPVHT